MTEVHFVSNKKRPFSSQEQNTHEFELVFTQNHLFHETQISSQESLKILIMNCYLRCTVVLWYVQCSIFLCGTIFNFWNVQDDVLPCIEKDCHCIVFGTGSTLYNGPQVLRHVCHVCLDHPSPWCNFGTRDPVGSESFPKGWKVIIIPICGTDL